MRSLAACAAHVLGLHEDDVPPDGELSVREWLAQHGAGIVEVADPVSFSWPGRFLGRLRESSEWVVMFGVPPGVLHDPAGRAEGAVELDAAIVIAPHRLPRPPAPSRAATGAVELIAVAPAAGAPMQVVPDARAIPGHGLAGDRYADGAGTFSDAGGRGHDLTLVDTEALEAVAKAGVALAPQDARRNLVTRGIALDDLIGRRFRVGEVECVGRRRCEPCAHLQRLTHPGVLRALAHRGGLRADVLSGGTIRVGDRVTQDA